MKKLNLLLIAFFAIIAFQACKTKQKVITESTKDTTGIAINDTIFNDQISDTICYIYTWDDIGKIKQQMPYDIMLQPDKPYSQFDLYSSIEMLYGQEAANRFVSVAKNYGKETSTQKVILENTQYYLNAVEEEGYVYPYIEYKDPMSMVKLEKVNNIPSKIKELFSNYPIFNKVNVMGHSKDKKLSTIYNGQLVPLSKLINKTLQEKDEKIQLSFEEKAELFFILIKGFDTKFSIKQIIEKPFYDEKIRNTWNYEIILLIDGKEEKYGLTYYNSRIERADLIANGNAYSISNPY